MVRFAWHCWSASRADWAFPTIDLSVGERLPNFALPTTAGREPVHLYDLLAERKTVLHIFASW